MRLFAFVFWLRVPPFCHQTRRSAYTFLKGSSMQAKLKALIGHKISVCAHGKDYAKMELCAVDKESMTLTNGKSEFVIPLPALTSFAYIPAPKK